MDLPCVRLCNWGGGREERSDASTLVFRAKAFDFPKRVVVLDVAVRS